MNKKTKIGGKFKIIINSLGMMIRVVAAQLTSHIPTFITHSMFVSFHSSKHLARRFTYDHFFFILIVKYIYLDTFTSTYTHRHIFMFREQHITSTHLLRHIYFDISYRHIHIDIFTSTYSHRHIHIDIFISTHLLRHITSTYRHIDIFISTHLLRHITSTHLLRHIYFDIFTLTYYIDISHRHINFDTFISTH
jgi:hypothetical protein